MYHLGSAGNVEVQRSSGVVGLREVDPADINQTLNRFGFDGAEDNILTGDRVVLTTKDPRGLAFFEPANWVTGTVENNITAYVHVNEAGCLRCFEKFDDALSNNRGREFSVAPFTGAPIAIEFTVVDVGYRLVGDITGYTFNTDREAIDTSALTDKFKSFYNAGILSGTGTIDCLFKSELECGDEVRETSMLLLQLIHRLDIGAGFRCYLALVDPLQTGGSTRSGVFYDVQALATRTGVEVSPSQVIRCSIDFVTTGEFTLRMGEPKEYLQKEDDWRIHTERDLGFLLKEVLY